MESKRVQRAKEYKQELQGIYNLVVKELLKRKTYRATGINLEYLSRQLEVDPRKIHRAIKTIGGTTLTDMLTHLRLNDAKERLCNPKWERYTIEEVGLSVGFVSRQSFHLVFQRELGCTPADFRRQHTENKYNKNE